METATKVSSGAAGLLLVIALVFSAGLIGEEDVYVCESTEIAMKCDKLSAVNSNGFQTRCYYEDEVMNKTRYKSCRSGWLPYVPAKEVRKLNNSIQVYLLCEESNQLIKECQVINKEEIIYKVNNE